MKKQPTAGTVTGRFPKGPALQNIPVRTETARALREAFLGNSTSTCEALDEREAKINGALPTDDLDELFDDSCGLSLPSD